MCLKYFTLSFLNIILQIEISSEEQWEEALSGPGLLVIEVYQRWCGPCKAVQNIFRKLRSEYGDDLLRLGGTLVSIVRGVNGPLLQKTMLELVDQEKKKQELGSKYVPEFEWRGFEEVLCVPLDHGTYHVVIIKPDAVVGGQVEGIIQKALDAGFSIVAEEERVLDEEQIHAFYKEKAKEPAFVKAMSSGPVHALIMSKGDEVGEGESHSLTAIIDPEHAELIQPKKRFGFSEVDLGMSESSTEVASRQLAYFFPTFDFSLEMDAGSNARIEKTLALIRPSLLREKKDEILKTIHDSGFQIAMQREVTLTEDQAKEFYKEHEGTDFFPCLINHMTSGPVLALALTRDDAIQHWRGLLGPKVLDEAKERFPESLRAQFAIDNVTINQIHGSSTPEEAQRDLNRFFPTEHTLAVIKPDSTQEHKDTIMNQIKEAGFSISQVKETKLTREMAEEFYKDHKGKDFFNNLVDYMSQ
uniref:Nucleoside diphosphate kinase-like domain-containing protein n=1 Tax=Oncorhynchus mykiss TaxID=8022 RepID=A0A8C7RR76_ONCMY